MVVEQGSERQAPEAERSPGEEDERPRQSYRGKETIDRWKKASFIFAAAAILFFIGLATSLGVFLARTQCAPPPRRDNTTTTFLGSASIGTEVDYFCQAPLTFPAGSPSFRVTCSKDLQWGPEDVPSCGIYSERLCTFTDLNLTLASRPAAPAGLEIQLTLDGSSPPTSMQLDIPIYEDDLCANDRELQGLHTLPTGREISPRLLPATIIDDEAAAVVIVFESMDPTQPFEVQVRSVGHKLAVTVLQEATTETVITSFPASSTTTAPPSTTIF